MTALLDRFHARLRLPLIAAPMLAVSGPELVTAACRAGVIGAFPAANCRTIDELDSWLATLRASLGADAAPFCPNLIMRRQSMREELDCLVRNRVEMVITSVGSPAPAIGPYAPGDGPYQVTATRILSTSFGSFTERPISL